MTDNDGLDGSDVVVDVHGLVEAATEMTPYFIALAGIPWDGEGRLPIMVGSTDSTSDSLDLDVQFRIHRGSFEHRFIASVVYEGYQLVADVGVRVTIPEPVRPTRRALDEYGARVAMFSAYPFLREGLTSLASRFELEPLSLPILRQPDNFEYEGDDIDEPVPLDDEPASE